MQAGGPALEADYTVHDGVNHGFSNDLVLFQLGIHCCIVAYPDQASPRGAASCFLEGDRIHQAGAETSTDTFYTHTQYLPLILNSCLIPLPQGETRR